MLRCMCGFNLKERKTLSLKKLLGLELISLVIRMGRLPWFGCVEYNYDADCVKGCMMMETEGTKQTGRSKKVWWDCVIGDMLCAIRTLQIRISGD